MNIKFFSFFLLLSTALFTTVFAAAPEGSDLTSIDVNRGVSAKRLRLDTRKVIVNRFF